MDQFNIDNYCRYCINCLKVFRMNFIPASVLTKGTHNAFENVKNMYYSFISQNICLISHFLGTRFVHMQHPDRVFKHRVTNH